MCWAASLNGEHYTGKIVGDDINGKYQRYEVQHALSAKEALSLNKKDEGRGMFGNMYKPGDMSDKFWTEQQLYRAAIRVYRQYFPDAIALITGSFCIADPQYVLDGPLVFKKKTNKLRDELLAIGGYEGNDDRANEIFNEYRKLLKTLDRL